MEGYQQLFALIKNPKYVKMRPPEKRAAIRIEQYCKRRKDRMKPKRQEDSSCVFAYYFVAALATAAIPQKKKERRNRFGADQEKKFCKKPSGRYGRKIVKGEASSRSVCRSQSAAPVIRGIAYPSIRRRADHRTPAEPSAAEFSGMVSATAPLEQGTFVPCGSVLTWHK